MNVKSFLIGVIMSGSVYGAFAGDIYLYRSDKNQEDLNLPTAKMIFEANRLSWSGGRNIVILVKNLEQINDSEFEAFSSLSKNQFNTRWRTKFFSGRARMPLQLPTAEAALQALKENQEAVYFSFEPLDPKTGLEGVRVDKYSY